MPVRTRYAIAWGFLLIFQAHAQPLNALSAQEKAEGFELLFDGTLESFRANFQDYRKNDSSLSGALGGGWRLDTVHRAIASTGFEPDIRSRRRYKDFDLRLQYRNTGNQGVFYRLLTTGVFAWETGLEFQIEDNLHHHPLDQAGAAYDLLPPRPNTYQPYSTGAWNDLRIVARGDSIEHWMNGTLVLGFKLHSPGFWEAYDRSKWKNFGHLTLKVPGDRDGGYIDQGHIGFQGDYGGKWLIRNLRVKVLEPAVSLRPRPRAEGGRASARPGNRARTSALPAGNGRWARPDGRQVPASGHHAGGRGP